MNDTQHPESATLLDGTTWTVGQRVRFHGGSAYGEATIKRIRRTPRESRFHLDDFSADTVFYPSGRWKLNPEAAGRHGHPDYNEPRDAGVSGGALLPLNVQEVA